MNKTVTGLTVVAVLAVCLLAWLVLEAGVWVLRTVAHLLAIGGITRTDEPRHEGLGILEPDAEQVAEPYAERVAEQVAEPYATDVLPEPPPTGPDSPPTPTGANPATNPAPTGTNPATDPALAWPSEEDNGHTGFTQAFPGFAEILRQTKAKAKAGD